METENKNENNMPLTNETFINVNEENEDNKDERFIMIWNTLTTIKGWITIIGIYFLIKIIAIIIKVYMVIKLGNEVKNILEIINV